MKWLGLVVALAAVPAVAAPPVPCGGGGADFAGDVIVGSFAPGSVGLKWSVWEDASTREYRVSRYPSGCARPSCATKVAKVRPTGGPASFKTYSLVDTAPPGAWIYRLEIRRHGPSCTLESNEILVDAPPACDAAALCAQVEASLYGTVIMGAALPGTVELRWLTHAETGAGSYRLSRFDCANPRDCSTEVATVDATGSCGQVMLHSVTDTPPAGSWSYALDVLDSGARVACTVRTPAAPASPTSR